MSAPPGPSQAPGQARSLHLLQLTVLGCIIMTPQMLTSMNHSTLHLQSITSGRVELNLITTGTNVVVQLVQEDQANGYNYFSLAQTFDM